MELLFSPSKLPKKGQRFVGAADAQTLVDIAAQLKILIIDRLDWDLVAKPWGKKGFRLDGAVNGTVAQACIVTLEPVFQKINEIMDLRFVPEDAVFNKPRKDGVEEEFNYDALPEDEPEIYSGDTFDAFPLVIEHLALGLDPYPRSPGAEFAESSTAPAEKSALSRALESWASKKNT